MRNLIITVLLTVFFVSCKVEKENKTVVINGNLENVDFDSVFVYNDSFKKAISLENGKFIDSLTLDQGAYVVFTAGRERVQLFLNPGDQFTIETDMADFDEKLTYSGTSANENNYLKIKQSEDDEVIYSDPATFFSVEPQDFRTKLIELKEKHLKNLEQTEVSERFKKLEEKNIEFQYYLMMLQYPIANGYFTQSQVDMPKEFEEEMSRLDVGNETDFNTVPLYRGYVVSHYNRLVEMKESPAEVLEIISSIQSNDIKNAVMESVLLYSVSTGSEGAQEFYDFIQKHATDEELKKESTEAYTAVQNILPGKESPKFNYPNINGKLVSLDDLKGNLVYIDVWATWCGPCLAEVPHLKELTSDYESKDIKVVSISIDPESDYNKWEKMVKEKELKGIQLFSDKDWNSQFVKDYGIKGIPRFILLDKEGKIISANAPRPSSPRIRSLIDANL